MPKKAINMQNKDRTKTITTDNRIRCLGCRKKHTPKEYLMVLYPPPLNEINAHQWICPSCGIVFVPRHILDGIIKRAHAPKSRIIKPTDTAFINT